MNHIAHIETPFREKFGVPRQAGLVDYEARVVFEPDYRVPEAVRGLEEFDYLWLLWLFDRNGTDGGWSPTVRPPRLGGNKRVGVFASRSPFRPNPIGLSSVRLLRIEEGPVLVVGGADLVDGTTIIDIKPYIEYADSHSGVRSGYAMAAPRPLEGVDDPQGCLARLGPQERHAIEATLMQDPRPHYQNDPSRVYTMAFGRHEVSFKVDGGRVEVLNIVNADSKTIFSVY